MMSASAMRDEKRAQRELGVLAMKKTIEYRVSYYQTRANAVAQQLIKHAHVSVFEFPSLLSPGRIASLDFSAASNSQYAPLV